MYNKQRETEMHSRRRGEELEWRMGRTCRRRMRRGG
jgi:hypothetical protein